MDLVEYGIWRRHGNNPASLLLRWCCGGAGNQKSTLCNLFWSLSFRHYGLCSVPHSIYTATNSKSYVIWSLCDVVTQLPIQPLELSSCVSNDNVTQNYHSFTYILAVSILRIIWNMQFNVIHHMYIILQLIYIHRRLTGNVQSWPSPGNLRGITIPKMN